ncbi:MAG TPA: hypothetical protein VNL38_02350, partial [Candidatus Nitrosotenuis sp.]|nr:hypothetical protein [Candidatus Nitrosotenuis sp.]
MKAQFRRARKETPPMKAKWVVLPAILALAVSPVWAQGRSGAQGRPNKSQGQQQRAQGAAKGGMSQDRQRIRATDQQREQFRTCDQAMDRVRQQARDMARTSGGAQFNAGEARQQRDRLREHFQLMQQEHERLMLGLNAEQRQSQEARHRNMEQIRERIQARLQEMDRELAAENPNGKQIAEQARNIEREMAQLQKHHRAMKADLEP